MKQTLLSKIFLILLLAGLPVLSYAQWNSVEFRHLETVVNQNLDFYFSNSLPVTPQATPGQHGTVSVVEVDPDTDTYKLTYTPQTDFIGVDTIRLNRYESSGNGMADVMITEIYVLPSFVVAEDDYTATSAGTSVTIPVLENDYGNGAWLKIARIPAVNSGTAVYSADSTQVIFTPDAGFSGIANLNYTICDSEGVCDMAIVNICVTDAGILSETLNVFTLSGEPQIILSDVGNYTLATEPAHGSVDVFDGQVYYAPDAGHTGSDYLRYEMANPDGSTNVREVFVRTLDRPAKNNFVMDDYVYTAAGMPVEFNVLANDLGSTFILNHPYVLSQPASGTLQYIGYGSTKGTFIYVPDGTENGIVEFTYFTGTGNGQNELGRGYIVVNDQLPVENTLSTVTPSNQPLVIEYKVPVDGYSFSITGPAGLGTAEVTNTYSSNGQSVSGQYLIVYEPIDGATGTDEFEVQYCALLSGECKVVKVQVELLDPSPASFCLGANCVWAGDANNDGVVNVADVLPIGLHMGEVGLQRTVDDSNFYGQYGADWNNPFVASASDLKHIDIDGDGIISADDTLAIRNFYGAQHGLTAPKVIADNATPQLYFGDYPHDAEVGDLVRIPIYLGHPNNPVYDVHGFTFSVSYPAALVENFKVNLTEDSWVSYNSPVLSMAVEPYDGLVDVGYTRTSATSLSGYGIIGTLDFVIIEDLGDIRLPEDFKINISVQNTGTMSGSGHMSYGANNQASIALNFGSSEEADVAQVRNEDLKVYPNPAGEIVNVHINGATNRLQEVEVYNLAGQRVHSSGRIDWKNGQIDVSGFAQGSYTLRAVTSAGVVHQQFQVVRD